MSSAVPIAARRPGKRANTSIMHLYMLVVTVCWAGNIVAGKEALRCFDAVALAVMRVLAAAILFGIGFVLSGKLRGLQLSRRKWIYVLAMAGTGVAMNQLLFIVGMAHTSVAHTGLIVALGPVMVLTIAVAIRLEPLTAGKLVGMLVAFAGVGLLTLDKSATGTGSQWEGDLIMLASIAVFSVYIVLVKEVANDFDGLTLNTLTFGLGALMMLPFCVRAMVNTEWNTIDLKAWGGLAFMVVLGTVVSYMLFAYAMTGMTASRAAAFYYLQPIIASGLGVWLLSERLTSKVLVGGGLILLGVYLTERERKEEKTTVASATA